LSNVWFSCIRTTTCSIGVDGVELPGVEPVEAVEAGVGDRAAEQRGADRKPEDAGSETAAGRKRGQTGFRCVAMMDLHL